MEEVCGRTGVDVILSSNSQSRIFGISVQPREIACPRQGKVKEGIVEGAEPNIAKRPPKRRHPPSHPRNIAVKRKEARKTQQVEETRNVVTDQKPVKTPLRMPHSSGGPSHIAGKGKGKEVEETQQVEQKFNVVKEQRKANTPLRKPHSPEAPSHIAGQRQEVHKTPQVEEDLNMVVTPPRKPTLPRTPDHLVEEDVVGQTTPETSPIGTVFNDFRLYRPWVDVPTPEKQPLESANQMSPMLRNNNDLLEGEASAPWRPPSPGKRRFRAPQSPYQALPKSGDCDNDCYTPTKTKGNLSTRKTPPSWMKSLFTATPTGSDLAFRDSPFSSISLPTTMSGKMKESAHSSARHSNETVRYESTEESVQPSANPSNEQDWSEQTSNEQYKPTEDSAQAPSNHNNEIILSKSTEESVQSSANPSNEKDWYEPTEESAQSSTCPDNEVTLFEPAERTPLSANPGKRHKPASLPKHLHSEEPLNENSDKSSDTNTFITPKRPKGRPNASSRRSEALLDAPSSSSNTGSPPKTTAVSPASSKIPIRTRPKLCGLSSSSNATTKPNLESQDLRARFARLRRQTVPEARESLRSKDGGGSQ